MPRIPALDGVRTFAIAIVIAVSFPQHDLRVTAMSEKDKKEIIVPKWVAGFLIVLGTLGILGIANSVPPATGSNQTAAKALPSYCANGAGYLLIECGWTQERQRQQEAAEQRRIEADLDAKAPRIGAFQNWQDCKEKPVSQLSYDELQNCDSLVGRR
jgi:hypothetical protein